MNLARLEAALLERADPGCYELAVPKRGVAVVRPVARGADLGAMCRHLRTRGWKSYLAEVPARIVVLDERPASGHWIMPREQVENVRASVVFLRLAHASPARIRAAERHLAELEEMERAGRLKPLYDDRPPLA
ncbi:MAG TPA: hypothetical protein VFN57_07400 [Thermomicrobiaceae bacterium]|nr:hypothetical protein [Thermomicrobiaceae bacterium]